MADLFLSNKNVAKNLIDKIDRVKDATSIEIQKGIEEIRKASKKKLGSDPRNPIIGHRYKLRSGNLSKGLDDEMFSDLHGAIWLDGDISGAGDYIMAIHQGHSGRNTKKNRGNQTWKPDKYLTNTGKALSPFVIENMKNKIKMELEK